MANRITATHAEILTALAEGACLELVSQGIYRINDRQYQYNDVVVLLNEECINDDTGLITACGRAFLNGDERWYDIVERSDGSTYYEA
jgi:hypothetical protein